ncbi:Gfo/Idh/MocA family oxidoreductase [Microbacterium sp. SSW1-49]|uniref:Gfo/Idh/MocA family oxidoreductase n=1 Tax=Microbacterium croceum TaxID=2851645 RepID=A0ABT0FA51_9MICO|nr:Gfo/Idh/MocA family oxidoreductase [Microbacterium croceum]MCK2034928.1 Gfo/Idh/MocA family oxidoreductase [Microbacterium croceum]
MTGRTVNVAIVGGGLMGREIAAAIQRWPALVDHPVRPRLTAVCDVNPAAFAWFEQIDTVTTTVTDYRDLLADDSIDVLYIAVRHDLHEQLYVDTIRAGKSLLAEKPFGIDRAAADAILAALAEHPESFVRCSSEMPFFPGAQAAIAHVASGALGRLIEVRSAFLHSSDLDLDKPINWKRQARFCGEAGVMNDLGLHAWHVPLRLGWTPARLTSVLQDLVPFRPGADGRPERCDTWENATVNSWFDQDDIEVPLRVETKRIAPGQKNTWEFEAIGLDGGVRYSTARPKTVEVFGVISPAGIGAEQSWQRIQVGSQSVWPTVTGGIFESGFSDAILQMWAAFLAEREGALGDRFACATPEEAAATHRIYEAALAAHASGRTELVEPVGVRTA